MRVAHSIPGWKRLTRCCTVLAVIVALAGCATPAERFDRRATALGLHAASLPGDGFNHRAYMAGLQPGSTTLHVYIEHDGTPWINFSRVSDDPTPRIPFALELMAKDSGPRLFLGRPCYFEPREDSRCNPLLWTRERYSAAVVASMVAALRGFLAGHPHPNVVLIGYSGGGTIAWLMAARIPEATRVVTVAANLDVDEWSRIHDYSPLRGSLNPALAPALAPAIEQLHFVGGRDTNVTLPVLTSFARRHPEARVIEIAEFDHRCCWIERWPQLLPGTSTVRGEIRGRAHPESGPSDAEPSIALH
jgi:pimeloyl-ACP methyl ester carboxylesterase